MAIDRYLKAKYNNGWTEGKMKRAAENIIRVLGVWDDSKDTTKVSLYDQYPNDFIDENSKKKTWGAQFKSVANRVFPLIEDSGWLNVDEMMLYLIAIGFMEKEESPFEIENLQEFKATIRRIAEDTLSGKLIYISTYYYPDGVYGKEFRRDVDDIRDGTIDIPDDMFVLRR